MPEHKQLAVYPETYSDVKQLRRELSAKEGEDMTIDDTIRYLLENHG